MRRRGLTLIELVVVVLIIGILAAVAVPRYWEQTRDAKINATMADLRAMGEAIKRYRLNNGDYPEDQSPGRFPPELTGYIREVHFTKKPPLGGKYDWQKEWSGFTAAVGIWQSSPDISLYQEIDDRFDDGDFNTGSIQKRAKTLNLILE